MGARPNLLFIFYALLIGVTAALLAPLVIPINAVGFDRAPLEELRAHPVRYAFFGSSYMNCRLGGERNVFHETMGPGEIYTPFGQEGNAMFWYLEMKNYLAASGVIPTATIVVFHDTDLTDTNFAISPNGRRFQQTMSQGYEPVVLSITSATGSDFYTWTKETVTLAYGASTETSKKVNDRVTTWFLEPLRESGESPEHALQSINDFLAKAPRRTDRPKEFFARQESPKTTLLDEFDFRGRLAHSFLPHMVEVGQQHKLNLRFFRVQNAPGNRSKPKRDQYIKDLREYFQANHIPFVDENDAPPLPSQWFASATDDHIIKDLRPEYQRYFYTTYRDFLK